MNKKPITVLFQSFTRIGLKNNNYFTILMDACKLLLENSTCPYYLTTIYTFWNMGVDVVVEVHYNFNGRTYYSTPKEREHHLVNTVVIVIQN